MKNVTGKIGEDFAAKLIESNGYEIIARNFRTRLGEIDIIAQNKEFIVFVEVKTRKENSFSTPLEAVDVRKQKKIIFAAEEYLQNISVNLQPRFDVIAITTKNNEVIISKIIENAF